MINQGDAQERPTVLVVGATGYLGRHIVAALRLAGYPVRALARDRDRLGFTPEAGIEVFVGHVTRPETLTGLCDGVGAVVSALGVRSLRRSPTPTQVDYQGNLNVLRLAERASVRRFIFAGVLHGERLQATVPVLKPREDFIDALRQSTVPATVLRLPGFFNDMEIIFQQARHGRAYLFGDGEARISPVHPADLGAEVVRRIADQTPGSVEVEVGGPDALSYNAIAALAFGALGERQRITHLPPGLVDGASLAFRPFNATGAGFLRFFSAVMTTDMVAPPIGTHHLADEFARLAVSVRAPTSERQPSPSHL